MVSTRRFIESSSRVNIYVFVVFLKKFEMASKQLKKLLKSVDFDEFKSICEILATENDTNSHCKLDNNEERCLHKLARDIVAEHLLDGILDNSKTVQSTPDGNCLFNSVSILVQGDEKLANELRLQTCVELATNIDFYKCHPLFDKIKIKTRSGKTYFTMEALYDVSAFGNSSSRVFGSHGFIPALEKEIVDTAIIGRYCGTLQIMGLATVLATPINLIYPNKDFQFFEVFQNIYEPRSPNFHNKTPYLLLWSNTNGWKNRDIPFRANHFVPVLIETPTIVNINLKQKSNTTTKDNKAKVYQKYISGNEQDNLPLTMPEKWYTNIAKNITTNQKRDISRSESCTPTGKIETLANAIEVLTTRVENEKSENKKRHLDAVLKTGKLIQQNLPVFATREVIEFYRKTKNLDTNKKQMAVEMFEILKKNLPVSQLLIKGQSYITEESLYGPIKSLLEKQINKLNHEDIIEYVSEKVGPIYKRSLDYMDTKRDKDVLKGVMTKLTSIRFASKLGQCSSRASHRNSLHSLENNLIKFEEIYQSSFNVRNDMTNLQQHQLHQRVVSKRKLTEMRTIAFGRGAKLKVETFPELPVILEGLFGASGLESHPRLIDNVLYRANSSAYTMKQAREALLALSPNTFNISLSCCYNYTQNFKAGTYQAKRHHEGRNVNACISLHAPPRVGVEHISPNLHWTTANVNCLIDNTSPESTIIDSKDGKSIVCGDIAPVQRPGKTWKKREGVLLDHEWNQSRTNAVTPMTHLILDQKINDSSTFTLRTGKGITLINLSFFETSSTIRCMNEFFKILLKPNLDVYFRDPTTNKLKQNLLFIVDNGPAEAPASILVQLLLIRLRKVLSLDSVLQVSFAEYHSKRNYVERVHASENEVLSKHGPFSSSTIHKNTTPSSEEHKENMEAMASEVIKCVSTATFGKKSLTCIRGVKDNEFIFDDEKKLKEFLSLSEGKKEVYKNQYQSYENDITRELSIVWGINFPFQGNYYDDYKDLMDAKLTWKNQYTFQNAKTPTNRTTIQPIPDFFRWLETDELHYLSLEKVKCLEPGIWKEMSSLFLPTRILKLVSDSGVCTFNQSDELFTAIAFLSWLPVKEAKEYLQHLSDKAEEELKNAFLRDAISQTDLYKKKKAALVKMCHDRKLPENGTKLDIGLRLAKSLSIAIETVGNIYKGDLTTIPQTTSQLRKQGISYLKSILKFHNLPFCGNKDELILKVALVKSNRQYMVTKKERAALKQLIFTTRSLIFEQRGLKGLCSQAKRRKFETPLNPSISKENPRRMASAHDAYTKSMIVVPEGLNEKNVEEILAQVESEINAMDREDTDTEVREVVRNERNLVTVDEDNYEKFFEIGAKVSVKWGQEDIGDSGWRCGWFVAEVQDYDIANDWVKIEYVSEPGSVYKLEVSPYIADQKIKFKSSLF